MNTNVLTILNREQMVDRMTDFMEKRFKDFKPCKEEFLSSVYALRCELGDEPVDKMLDALNRRCEADMLFCGSLGYQANLQNFRDPIARTFLDADFEDYLRVDILASMPQRDEAERELDEFYHSLNEEQKGTYEAISSYMVSLELDLTKLAHYSGYMFANEMLPFTEPGYTINSSLTFAYKRFMEEWFGVAIDADAVCAEIKESVKGTNEETEGP